MSSLLLPFPRLLAALLIALAGLLAAPPSLSASNLRLEAIDTDENGWSAVHRAAEAGDIEKLRAFAAAGAFLDRTHPENGERPQHRAARAEKFEALRFLVERGGIDVGVGDNNGASVLYWVARARDLELTRWLIDRGAPVVAQKGWHPLLGAAIGGSPEQVRFYLDLGIPRDLPDKDGYTALHLAAMFGQVEAIEVLGDAATSHEEWANLLFKALAGNRASPADAAKLCRHLIGRLKKSAPPESLARHLHDALVNAYYHRASDEVLEALRQEGARLESAAPSRSGSVAQDIFGNPRVHPEVVKRLIAHGADLNRRDGAGNTPLHNAAEHLDLPSLRLLIDAGADPFVVNNDGWTLLHAAAGNGKVAMPVWRYLIELGIDVNARNKRGNTPLMLAAQRAENVAQLRDLLAAGANPLMQNDEGETALARARKFDDGTGTGVSHARIQVLVAAEAKAREAGAGGSPAR
jgi:ankyrin repeat protein